MNFRKPDKTADLIDSIINSENGKVQKYVLERKRKEKEFLEKKENIKKKSMMAPKLNQMFVKNKNEDDKLISETIGLRTVHEYKKIKDEIYSNKKDNDLRERTQDDKHTKQKNFKLSFLSEDDDSDINKNESDDNKNESDDNKNESDDNKNESDDNKNESNDNKNNGDGNKSDNDMLGQQNDLNNNKSYEKNENKKELSSNRNKNKLDNKNAFTNKIMKDPTVNTSFLKDKERDKKIELKKKELRELYYKLENEQKEKVIDITYSYYDGSGHRRKISVKQKNTIGQFINKCVDNLKNEFIQLRSASCETLMFVKEDVILPNYITFYELIKNKAQGKTGPLFSFDAVENLSGITDIRKEKTDTHAGKLVEKKWYEKNKHIFPASKWEIYKPLKTYTTSYTDLFNKFI
ncbi:XAP-5 DNA binding protein, putative [Plasmodium reichenowi]|uniref:XAP-5 DNA binding protein, putative n=1 Tax=Plasmodium reichenowi TaxID=5854 RepID=A0A060RUG2_PLARE|nr:XAP-5 DNA binding protein, putative [Plasmodium reichenowi]